MSSKDGEISINLNPASGDRASQRRSKKTNSRLKRKEVGIACEVRLIAVDDVSETFTAAILIHLHFKDRTVKKNASEVDEFMRDPDYNGFMPKVTLVNCIEGGEFDIVVRVNPATGVVWTAFQTVAHINESLELKQFPFDRQLFRIAFKSPNCSFKEMWSQDVAMLDLPDNFDKHRTPNMSPFLASCELNTWHMESLQVGQHKNDADPVGLTKGEFKLTIQAERDPNYYLNNFVFVVFLIVLFNAASVCMDVNMMGDRLAFGAGLLLTAVAFKFVLSEAIPKVGYSTLFDYFLIISFMFLGVGISENVIVSPHVRCMSLFYNSGKPADDLAEEYSQCQSDQLIGATQLDGIFHAVYVLLWILINSIVVLAAKFPSMVRPSWNDVVSRQIGETAETIKRSHVICDLDGTEPVY